jgi:Myb-like DNA-binding domain
MHEPHFSGRDRNHFSRAVSSSFDRSIKSAPAHATDHPKLSVLPPPPPQDCGSVSEDASWGALKQVHSVDEEELRRRLAKRKDREKDVIVNQPNSNSSSLTNSPTEGVEGKEKPVKSSLDSLSSAASAQEPLTTKKAPSPDDSAPSLDLMKCPSGSSALLLPSHHRSLSQFSLGMLSKTNTTRDEYDDEREGVEVQPPAPKRKKSSPLSITCSPPTTPKGGAHKESKMHQPQPLYPKPDDTAAAYYDKPPQYSYSMEGPRPGSSASSTITPVDGLRSAPGVGTIPSWEIHPQDSLVGSFSFAPDYDGGHPPQHLESRNQSFEGGHYHGGFSRTDSMISYEGNGHPGMYEHPHARYQGNFPPHAPSWGSAGSYPPPYMPRGYPPQMRHMEDARTSPPPSRFPPPPDFRVPPSMVQKSGPQNTILTSSYPASPKNGPFGWSKEEDSRLTEIMKKYKNPRDWEPIAKEHNRGRSAKECHERWIRYLKPGVRKGQWTDHEDAVVMEVVTTSSEQPFTRWSDLAQRLPGRVGKQIRDRWVNHLNPAINHLPFSREDDLNLWEGHTQLGKRWVEIATKNFNNTRSENHIKNRWYSASFKKFIANEFGPDAYNGGKCDPDDPSVGSHATSPESPKKKAGPRRSLDPSQMEAV